MGSNGAKGLISLFTLRIKELFLEFVLFPEVLLFWILKLIIALFITMCIFRKHTIKNNMCLQGYQSVGLAIIGQLLNNC